MSWEIEEKERREQTARNMEQLQELINPKPPKEERERMINERLAAREIKVIFPSEIKEMLEELPRALKAAAEESGISLAEAAANAAKAAEAGYTIGPSETKQAICSRCNGKGGFQQVSSYFPDGEPDINWDVCPDCNGSGKA